MSGEEQSREEREMMQKKLGGGRRRLSGNAGSRESWMDLDGQIRVWIV